MRLAGTTATLQLIPDGAAGTLATLKIMRDVTRVGKKSLPVRMRAASLVQHLMQKDYTGEARTLHAYVRDEIRYIRDINGVETIQTPEQTLQLGYGDCDDKSTLLAAMLESIGHPTRFVAIGFSPNNYEHVYVETKIGNKWVPAETTEPWPLGQAAPASMVRARMEMYN